MVAGLLGGLNWHFYMTPCGPQRPAARSNKKVSLTDTAHSFAYKIKQRIFPIFFVTALKPAQVNLPLRQESNSNFSVSLRPCADKRHRK